MAETLSDAVRDRPTAAEPSAAFRFSDSLGLATPQETRRLPAKIEQARADLKASGEQIAAMEELTATGLEQGAAGVAGLSRERADVAAKSRPVPPTLPKPPEARSRAFLEPGPGFLSQLQTAMAGIGQLGMQIQGLKGGGHAIAATVALKGMLEGWQAGDAERVKRNYTEWKAEHERLLQEHTIARTTYQDILKDFDRSIEDRLAEIGLRAQVAGHRVLAEQARSGNLAGVLQSLEGDRDAAIKQQQFEVQAAHWHAQGVKDQRNFERLLQNDRALAETRAATQDVQRQRLQLSKDRQAGVEKLEVEDAGLSNKLIQMDQLEDAVKRLDKKGVIRRGPTAAEGLVAATKLQTAFGDEQTASDIEVVKRMGTALLIGSEIAAGLSPGVARLKLIGEAEAAGASSLPKAFWDTWFVRQRASMKDRQRVVRQRIEASGRPVARGEDEGVILETTP